MVMRSSAAATATVCSTRAERRGWGVSGDKRVEVAIVSTFCPSCELKVLIRANYFAKPFACHHLKVFLYRSRVSLRAETNQTRESNQTALQSFEAIRSCLRRKAHRTDTHYFRRR